MGGEPVHFIRNKFLQALGVVLICGLLFPGISEAASYTVKSGDSLWVIANRYNTTVAKLQQLNNIPGSLIYPGQVLKVSSEPAQNPNPPASQPSAPGSSTYTVKSGDSLWVIANRFKMTVAQLQKLNNITGSLIYPGQVLKVKGEPAQNPDPPQNPNPPASEPSAPSTSTYTVKSGDSLWAIANRYGITVSKLMSLNNLKGTTIYPGQVLKVGEQTSGDNPSRGGSSIVQTAYRYLNVPYVWGGISSSGFDCSGLVKHVYSIHGINLPRVACDQANAGTKIWSMSQLQVGDIVCFSGKRNGYVDHVGIYIGSNQIIHASSSAGRVVVSSLSGNWYQQAFVHGVRVL
jgi:peptidoglycan endopeptidase LytE